MDEHRLSNDDPANILKEIQELLAMDMDMTFCTGGMSVDPDDMTPAAIRDTGAEIVTYGGAGIARSYVPAVLLSGIVMELCRFVACRAVMYAATTIFDLVLPRLIAGERITKQSLRGLDMAAFVLAASLVGIQIAALARESEGASQWKRN